MGFIDEAVSAAKAAAGLYDWLVTNHLRDRRARASRDLSTASVLRSVSAKLRWYEWPAARTLQREGHGWIEGSYYRTWVDVTPRGVVVARQLSGR